MLSDYIVDYISAKANGDAKAIARIEKSLAKLGMDRRTLLAAAAAIKATERREGERTE